jgi:hypothetical protein
MPDDPGLTERVRRQLVGQVDVVEKRMFGSIGFMVGGMLRIGVGRHPDHVMLVRVPPEQEAAALAQPGAHPATMGGRPRRGWLFLEDRAVETDEQLERWIEVALAAEA